MKFTLPRNGWLAATLAGMLVLGACGDDPTVPDDHAEPEGVVLRLNGQVLASYDGGTWSGEVALSVGQETGSITVQFVDDHGDPLEADDEEYLDVIMGNSSIADFLSDAPGAFTGRLSGKAVGQTFATFRLMHGAVGSGHPDYVAAPLTVRVN